MTTPADGPQSAPKGRKAADPHKAPESPAERSRGLLADGPMYVVLERAEGRGPRVIGSAISRFILVHTTPEDAWMGRAWKKKAFPHRKYTLCVLSEVLDLEKDKEEQG